jgi:hypothetical protein
MQVRILRPPLQLPTLGRQPGSISSRSTAVRNLASEHVIRAMAVALTVLANHAWPARLACQIVAQPDRRTLETAPTELRVGEVQVRLSTDVYVMTDAAPSSSNYGLQGFVTLEITGDGVAPTAFSADRVWLLQGDSTATGSLETDRKTFRIGTGPWTRAAFVRGSWPDWVQRAKSPDVVVRLVRDSLVLGYVRAAAQTVRAVLANGRTPCLSESPPAIWAGTGILFALGEAYGGFRHLEPIAVVQRGRLQEPPGGCDLPGFRKAFYQAGRRYEVLSSGEVIGHATVVAADTEGACTEPRSAAARLDMRQPFAPTMNRPAIAADSGRLTSFSLRSRPLASAEESLFSSLTKRALAASGIPGTITLHLKTGSGFAVMVPNQATPLLLGSSSTDEAQGDSVAPTVNAFTLFAQHDHKYEPELVWHHEGEEADVAQQFFVDIIQLSRDSALALVTQGMYYESWDYWIYRRNRAGSWARVYRGGGGGC